jgi:hypothetical protein
MKTGFNDPIKIRENKPRNSPENGRNSPWDFRCPAYDERTSCFVSAGTHYGVGHKQPVGHHGNPSKGSAIPQGRVTTMRIDEKG